MPLSAKQLQARVRELERQLGKKTSEAEILKEAGAEPLKKTAVALELAQTGRFQVKAVAQTMRVARSNLVELLKRAEPTARRPPSDDDWLLPVIRAIVAERPSYGYHRVTALLNRSRVSDRLNADSAGATAAVKGGARRRAQRVHP